MIYPANFEAKIGFEAVRSEVERHCVSTLGAACVAEIRFSTDVRQVRQWLEEVNEFMDIVRSGREFPLDGYYDLRSVLKQVATPGTYLSTERLHDLQRMLWAVGRVQRFFSVGGGNDEEGNRPYPRLRALTQHLQALPTVSAAIAAVLDKDGNMLDNASPLLSELRQRLARATTSVGGTLRHVIDQGRRDGVLDADVQPTLRDGRLVIPVPSAGKRKLRGIVHDESASGKTVFIEPEAVVEANNRIRETEAQIAREIIRILVEVTNQVRPHLDDLQAAMDTLGSLDYVRAKALFALDVEAQMPHVDDSPVLECYGAVHPTLLLALREQGRQVVPLDITLDSQQRILVVSGPNAGGKSVCLKTVGIVQYMMQCGIMPTVRDNSHLGIFEDILMDIGDQQSIENDLSTYSSHLQNMKLFLSRGGKRSLILIDEMGSGTEPLMGGAIAQAILEQLNQHQVMGVVTTHYQNLKQLADETDGLVNGAMLYDRQHLTPLFQLSMGYPGSSFAIEIARQTGLPAHVIDKASEIVGSDYVNIDKFLLDIVRDRRYWENKRRDIRSKEKRLDSLVADYEQRLGQIGSEYRQIVQQAKDEAHDILQRSNAQIEHTIQDIRRTQAEKQRTKQVRQQLQEFKQRLEQGEVADPQRLRQLQPRRQPRRKPATAGTQQPANTPPPLRQGDQVVLKGTNTVGTLISIDEKYALVAFGNIKTRVGAGDVQRANRQHTRGQRADVLSRATSDAIRERQLRFKPDIDVRGMRADEALQAITYFLDDAIQFNAQRVRILHGTGTGALRQAIRQYLPTVAGVARFHDEHVQMGGAGITVVELQ